MARSNVPATKAAEHTAMENSPPPVIAPLLPVPALDLREYGAELYSVPDLPSPQPSSPQNLGVRPTNADEITGTLGEQSQSIRDGVASHRKNGHTHRFLSRPSFRARGTRTSSYAGPPSPRTTSNPASAPTTPYMSADKASTENLGSQSGGQPGPTPPTAISLATLGPPPGNGPGHVRKIKQRITIWTEEMAEVNETTPTKPLPKPLKEWERLGRRVLKRRGQDEWPGPMQDGERVDKTGMYDGVRRELSEGKYWGPHPKLNRGDRMSVERGTSFSSSSEVEGDEGNSPAFPTRNILIDNNDGAADSPDALKLSPATTSSNEVDLSKKAKNATDERLVRAAKLLAKQQKNADKKDVQRSSDGNGIMSAKAPAPAERKRNIDLKVWRKSLGPKKP